MVFDVFPTYYSNSKYQQKQRKKYDRLIFISYLSLFCYSVKELGFLNAEILSFE